MISGKKRFMLLLSILMVCLLCGCTANSSSGQKTDQTPEQENSEMTKEIAESVIQSETISEAESGVATIPDTEVGTETESSTTTESDTETESSTATESDTETAADSYGPVKVSELDYDSFQDRMTAEEWEGLQMYFPVLRENAAFELAGNYEELNRDGKPVENGEYVLFYRYTFQKMTDIDSYVGQYAGDGIEEMLVQNVQVTDLDGDSVQELILQWTPVGDYLILHLEKEAFYGWEIMLRGFEALQTNGAFIGSGGAGANKWLTLQFDHGSWQEEVLAEEDWGEYYLRGEKVDEAAFHKQVDSYWTEYVTEYEPKQRTDH